MASSTLSANSQNVKKFGNKQKFRSFITILAVGVPLILVVVSLVIYNNVVNPKKTTNDNASMITGDDQSILSKDQTSEDLLTGGSSNVMPGDLGSGAPTPQTSSSPSSPQPALGGTSATQPNASPISGTTPSGVQTAINSIESSGIKGNSYVSSTMDTSQIPPGTSIKFDSSSWDQYSDSSGRVNATASVLGQNKKIYVFFEIVDGSWKATSYGFQD